MASASYRLAKRGFDLMVAIPGSILLSPLFLATAALVFWRLGRPVLFRQERAGMNGEAFFILKFRTMTLERDKAGCLLADAARMTPFGRFLRSTSLDELPQLVNVLRGDMSLVGPRPLYIRYIPRYTPEQRRRLLVLPGITGLAQVAGRNALSWEERFELDRQYVERASVLLDLKILFLTISKVFRRSGISGEGQATMSEFMGCCEGERRG